MIDILLLGTYHMDNSPNLFNAHDDIRAAHRQREILEVVERLKKFRATHVAVERLPEVQAQLDDEYRRYLSGTFQLPDREVYQIGFRVAQELGLDGVTAIDMKNEVGEGIGGVYEYARQQMPELFDQLNQMGETYVAEMQRTMDRQPVREVLRWLNQPSVVREHHRPYLLMTQRDCQRPSGIAVGCRVVCPEPYNLRQSCPEIRPRSALAGDLWCGSRAPLDAVSSRSG